MTVYVILVKHRHDPMDDSNGIDDASILGVFTSEDAAKWYLLKYPPAWAAADIVPQQLLD